MQFVGLLSADECKAILKSIESKHESKARSLEPGSRSQFRLNDKKLSEKIWQRIRKHLPQEMDGGEALGLREGWNHARYFPGQSVFAHMDQRQTSEEHKGDKTVASRMSLTIYLDEGYSGAEFVFVKGARLDGSYEKAHKVLTPKAGDAVIFYQGVPEFFHAVPPLKTKIKSIMRSDVLYKFKSEEEADVGGERGIKGGDPVPRE